MANRHPSTVSLINLSADGGPFYRPVPLRCTFDHNLSTDGKLTASLDYNRDIIRLLSCTVPTLGTHIAYSSMYAKVPRCRTAWHICLHIAKVMLTVWTDPHALNYVTDRSNVDITQLDIGVLIATVLPRQLQWNWICYEHNWLGMKKAHCNMFAKYVSVYMDYVVGGI